MTRQTEQLEQEFIDAYIEEERTPNHEETSLGRVVIESMEQEVDG